MLGVGYLASKLPLFGSVSGTRKSWLGGGGIFEERRGDIHCAVLDCVSSN